MMWVSKRFDVRWSDLAVGAGRCLLPAAREPAAAEVERLWGGSREALACLSVRSAFDLLLEALHLPEGSDVVFSALTVSDMPEIALAHGLHPVPCDLNTRTGAPGMAEVQKACTPRTRLLVLAHLFGARMDIGPVAAWARERGILVVEDCAQAYAGPGYRGHEGTAASLFSFGPIKHATALGGAVAMVRDPALMHRVRELHRAWPTQPRGEYLRRVLKYALLHALSMRITYTAFAWLVRAMGKDLDSLVNRLTRGFAGPGLLRRIRRQPCAPLLRVLSRRLRQDSARLRANEVRGRQLLGDAGAGHLCPGAELQPHTFWLLPIVTEDPPRALKIFRARGFDATRGRSFTVVGNGTAAAPVAERIHRHAVYAPFYPPMSDRTIHELASAIRDVAADGALLSGATER